jgi:HEAT repeat protein
MSSIHCPYCGLANTEGAARNDGSFVCQSCGKAVEPPPVVPPPPAPSDLPGDLRDRRRWSDGPPEESANRWSMVGPWGDDESSSSVSVSQTSILPRDTPEKAAEPPLIKPARSPVVWLLVILVLFVALLAGAIMLAKSIRPWLDARRAAADRATVEHWWPKLDGGGNESRLEAARAIVDLGPNAVVRTLDHISQDSANGEAFLFVLPAVHALAAVGPDAVAGLIEGLRSPQPKIRAAAASVLQEMGRTGLATREVLVAGLDDDDHRVRLDVIDALGALGAEAAPSSKRLTELASSRDVHTQCHAIDALCRIGPPAIDALPTLETIQTKDINAITRSRAALAMKQIDVQRLAGKARRHATGSLKPLLQAVLSEDGAAAIAAAGKLGDMGLAAEPAAVGLAAMLHHDDPLRRAAAAAALGKLGLGAMEFVPTLQSAIADDDPRVRAAATSALEMINGKPK